MKALGCPLWQDRYASRTLSRDMDERAATLRGLIVSDVTEILCASTATVRRVVKNGQPAGRHSKRSQAAACVAYIGSQWEVLETPGEEWVRWNIARQEASSARPLEW